MSARSLAPTPDSTSPAAAGMSASSASPQGVLPTQMRRLISLACAVAVLGIGLMLAFGGPAFATPAVTFNAAFARIAGTSSGALMDLEYGISGSEYDGSPPPLIGLNLILPDGAKLHTEGFPTCPAATLENGGAGACPQESQAGPMGSVSSVFSLAGERIPENAAVQPYFASGGGLEFYLTAPSPISVEKIANGRYANLDGEGGEGPEIITQVPLVETVPGAPDMSIAAIELAVAGAASTASGRMSSYVTLPETCPHGGFPVKTELIFAGLGGLAQQTVIGESKAPCLAGSQTSAPVETSVAGTGGAVTLLSNRVCLSRRDFTIHVRQMKGLHYRRVSVVVNGRRVAVVRGSRSSANVDLRGLPKGRYVVRITVTTSTGRRITEARAYHTCESKSLPLGRS